MYLCRTSVAYEEQAFQQKDVLLPAGGGLKPPLTPSSTWILSFVPTAEGFYSFTENRYIYQYRNHLGNARVNYAKNSQGSPEVTDTNNYYAFGMNHIGGMKSMLGSYQNYKYNGKELQETGMYDYGARFYMADIGRWGVVDPLAEKMTRHSPYNYAFNNPVKYTDPDGKEPYCPKCSSQTYIPLADGAYSINKGEKTSNGWTAIRVDSDSKSGYRGVLYEGKYAGKTEYIYATAGTDDGGDWSNNLKQLSGKSEQYSMSIGIARSLANNDKYEGISFTGHSLGGGLASANALATEGKAVTFNAAGLSDATKNNNNLNGNVANINAFIVKGEILDWEARTTPRLNRAEGKKIVMPSAYTNWNQVNRVRNHMMGAVKISFQKFIEESKKKN